MAVFSATRPHEAADYWLADLGYYNCDYLLTPYQKTRYHLNKWERSDHGPQTKEELFNLWHAQLRNVIECIFGVVKGKYPILKQPPPFALHIQVALVPALAAVYNFLASHGHNEGNDAEFRPASDHSDSIDGPALPGMSRMESSAATRRMKKVRDDIALAMWRQRSGT